MNLRKDLPASMVVFFVAVPLSLGIALASGAPIIAGLIGAICGGILTGLLAGAPLQVSGPAAGLTVVVFGMVQQFGWQTVCLITACAGALQLLLGFFKVARNAMMISPSVVHGMLAGIGISIALAQLQVVLGGKPQSSPLVNLLQIPKQIGAMNVHATILGAMTFVLLVVWRKLPWKTLKAVPGPLVAVLAGTLVSIVIKMDVARVDLPDKFELTKLLPPAAWGKFAVAVVTVAVIASIESLLCAVATDKLHSGDRCNLDKELCAQGAGNLASGLLGGLPITGVIVRSSANIMAGGVSRWSAIFHGIWILLSALFLGSLIERIPLAVLAGLLVHVGVNLVNIHHIRELKKHGEIIIYVLTILGVTCINLLAGVGLGLGLAVLLGIHRLSQNRMDLTTSGEVWTAKLEGSLTFATVPKLMSVLAKVPPGKSVHLDLDLRHMDHAAYEALHGWQQNHERTGGKVHVREGREPWYQSALDGKPRTILASP